MNTNACIGIPNEIWDIIFNYVSYPDIHNATLVCKDWHAMVDVEVYYKRFKKQAVEIISRTNSVVYDSFNYEGSLIVDGVYIRYSESTELARVVMYAGLWKYEYYEYDFDGYSNVIYAYQDRVDIVNGTIDRLDIHQYDVNDIMFTIDQSSDRLALVRKFCDKHFKVE